MFESGCASFVLQMGASSLVSKILTVHDTIRLELSVDRQTSS